MNKQDDVERRTSPRFPLELPLTFRTLSPPLVPGSPPGRSLNISSSGVLFETEVPLKSGQHVVVSVEWPARLDRRVPLNLILEGRIVRCREGKAALQAHRHEFRTRGAGQGQEGSGDLGSEGSNPEDLGGIRAITPFAGRMVASRMSA